MKAAIGFIFGILVLWLCATTDFVDNAVIFLLAGTVPGTGISLSPEVMSAIFMVMLGLLVLAGLVWLAGRPSRREVAAASQKITVASAAAATGRPEDAALRAATQALQRHRQASFAATLTAAAASGVTKAARHTNRAKQTAQKRVRRAGLPGMSAVQAALAKLLSRMTGARLQKRLKQYAARLARYGRRGAKLAKTAARTTAATLRRLLARLTSYARRTWRRLRREAAYAAKGTKLAAKGRLITLKHSVKPTGDAKRFLDLLRARLRREDMTDQ